MRQVTDASLWIPIVPAKAKKNLHITVEVIFVFALPIFTARAIYRPAVASVRGTLAGSCSHVEI